jgi:signal transduction histidine kinase
MKISSKSSEILKSRVFWKIFVWILLGTALLLIFPAFIIFSGFEADLGPALSASKVQNDYTLLKEQLFIILALLYLVFACVGFFCARVLALRIIRTSQYIKKLDQAKLNDELEIATDDEFKEIAFNLNNLAVKLKECQEKKSFIDKIKSDFVTIAAHQLRTPLSTIKWTLHSLKNEDDGKLNKAQAQYVKNGIETSERMINLINDLLSVSRIEQGEFDYEFKNDDPRKIIKQALRTYRPECKKKGIKLSSALYDKKLNIKHDPQKIKLALENLLSNATKYTPEGGKITVTAAIKKDVIEVAVKDNGMGIPKEEQSKMFQKFFRGEKMKIDTEGNGLGLFITKSIIEKHGGGIRFRSRSGKGTTFYFTLPIKGREDSQKSFQEIVNKV